MITHIINKENFDGEWKFIPRRNNCNNQLVLTKNYFGKKLGCNFNFDQKEAIIGRPVSLINVLLGLEEEIFYKRVINDNSIEFIAMNSDEIKTYKENSKRTKDEK